MERVAAGRGTSPLTFRAMEGVAAGRDASARVLSDGGGGRQRGALCSYFKQRRGWWQSEGPLRSRFEIQGGWWQAEGPLHSRFEPQRGEKSLEVAGCQLL